MEYLDDCVTLKDHIDAMLQEDNRLACRQIAEQIGSVVAKLHDNNIIHGDLTTSNFLVRNAASDDPQLILIDFGLTSLESSNGAEEKGGLQHTSHTIHLVYFLNLIFLHYWCLCNTYPCSSARIVSLLFSLSVYCIPRFVMFIYGK